MSPGKLNKRITIRYYPVVDDGQGGRTTKGQALTDLCSVWAEFERPRATTDLQQGSFASVLTHTVNIRYREDVQMNYQLYAGTKVYKILHVYHPDREMTTLICQEVNRG